MEYVQFCTLYVDMDRLMTAVCAFVQFLSQEQDVSDGGPEVRELRDELQSVAVEVNRRR